MDGGEALEPGHSVFSPLSSPLCSASQQADLHGLHWGLLCHLSPLDVISRENRKEGGEDLNFVAPSLWGYLGLAVPQDCKP